MSSFDACIEQQTRASSFARTSQSLMWRSSHGLQGGGSVYVLVGVDGSVWEGRTLRGRVH